jgi:hypothetical protein
MRLEPAERAAIAARGVVGHQHQAPSAREQGLGERLGGEDMAAGPAGGEDDQLLAHVASPAP